MNKHLKIAAALLVALPTLTFAQVRTEQTFEKGWKFTREDKYSLLLEGIHFTLSSNVAITLLV